MEGWKIIFLSKWVICRFQPLIFQGLVIEVFPGVTGCSSTPPDTLLMAQKVPLQQLRVVVLLHDSQAFFLTFSSTAGLLPSRVTARMIFPSQHAHLADVSLKKGTYIPSGPGTLT